VVQELFDRVCDDRSDVDVVDLVRHAVCCDDARASLRNLSDWSANKPWTAMHIGFGTPGSTVIRTASSIVRPLEMMSSTSIGVRPSRCCMSLIEIAASRSPRRTFCSTPSTCSRALIAANDLDFAQPSVEQYAW